MISRIILLTTHDHTTVLIIIIIILMIIINIYLWTSGDGSLSVLNMRQCKFEERSDCSESELLCVTTVKVLCEI